MRRYALALAALMIATAAWLALPATASAQQIEQVTERIHKATLDNGLEVYVVEDHTLPLVTIEMVVRNGAFTEPPEYDGLSHLYEHMFFKGNEAIPSQEAYLARQRELGMRWNGTTSTERVNYFFTMPSDRWKAGLEFMKNAIRHPLFKQEELEKERNVVLDELSRNESNPYFHLRRQVDEALWYEFPSYKNTIGDREIISTATREKMITVQNKFYIPNNSALYVAGDVEPQAVVEAANELYGDWEKGPDPFVKYPLPEHPPLEAPKAVIVEQPIQAVAVSIAWHGPDTENDPEATYAADVFSFILNQEGSAFQKALVDSGLTLGASISYYTQRNVGPISISFQTTPDKVQPALEAVAAEIEKFDDPDYFSDEQIETAKTLLEVSDIYSREKTSSWVHTLSFWWSSAGLDYYLGYIENLRAVTREDMTRYVETYIQGQPYVLGALMSSETRETNEFTKDKLLNWFSMP